MEKRGRKGKAYKNEHGPSETSAPLTYLIKQLRTTLYRIQVLQICQTYIPVNIWFFYPVFAENYEQLLIWRTQGKNKSLSSPLTAMRVP